MHRHSLICRFDATDRTRVQVVDPNSQRTVIHFVSGEHRFDYGLGSLLERVAFLGLQPPEAAFDLALLAALVFCADTRLSRESEAQDGWTRAIDLYLPVADVELWETQCARIEDMLRFLTGDQWRLFCRVRPRGYRAIVPKVAERQLPRFTCASLFSGGLDSYIGAIDLLGEKQVPLLVSHHMEGTTKSHQDICLASLGAAYGAESFKALQNYVCFKSEIVRGVDEDPNQRARSFLFFGLGALAASGLEDATLYIPENGLIALNVPLDPLRLGALSTRTTHPYFMARYNELLVALGLGVTLTNPYRHRTKGQMAAGCRNAVLLQGTAANTMSCSSPTKGRWQGLAPAHCGYCVPCLIRRASLVKAFGTDPTTYHLANLAAVPLDCSKAEGQHIRSFQLALARLHANPNLARTAIHSPGPLTDFRDEWPDFARVYADGMAEVGALLRGVVTRPL
jgi:hypothetical protein